MLKEAHPSFLHWRKILEGAESQGFRLLLFQRLGNEEKMGGYGNGNKT